MPIYTRSIHEFINIMETEKLPVIDVRSEAEFNHAHIPGAINKPILKDDERKLVGLIFKQKGKHAAILKGFELVGPRFHEIIKESATNFPELNVLMYCWRGGMRSNIMAWLLSSYGFNITLLSGGYKSFRHWVFETLQKEKKVIVLGGATGSGKTEILGKLSAANEQVIDLEHLANHKGSAFGSLGLGSQPSNEQFENVLAIAWNRVNDSRLLWLENESKTIGSCILPPNIYNLIRTSPLVNINVGNERRFIRIRNEYGTFPVETLKKTTEKIKKRLGPQHLKQANDHLDQDNFEGWLEIVMKYYDKLYAYGTESRNKEKVLHLDLSSTDEINFVDVIKREVYNLKEKAGYTRSQNE